MKDAKASNEFWSEPERVEEFARREPDLRLAAILNDYPTPTHTRVLDLGCAGGRNLRLLMQRGFDAYALDLAEGMVERARSEIAPLCGEAEAERRVMLRGVEDLSFAEDASFELVVALGILHMAPDEPSLHALIAETSRILVPDGRLLVAIFGPGTMMDGDALESVPGDRFAHLTPEGRGITLVSAADLDEVMAHHDLEPVVPTETVERDRKGTHRVVNNGLYRKVRT